MTKLLTILSLLVLTACAPLSYDDVKKKEKYCTDRGMKVEISHDRQGYPYFVYCIESNGNRYRVKE